MAMQANLENVAFFLEFCIFRNWYLEPYEVRAKILKGDIRPLEIHYQTRNLFFDDYLERLNRTEKWSDYAEFFRDYYHSTILDPIYAEKWKAVDERLIYQQLIVLEQSDIELKALAELDREKLFKTSIEIYKRLFHLKGSRLTRLNKSLFLSLAVYLFFYASIYMIKN